MNRVTNFMVIFAFRKINGIRKCIIILLKIKFTKASMLFLTKKNNSCLSKHFFMLSTVHTHYATCTWNYKCPQLSG